MLLLQRRVFKLLNFFFFYLFLSCCALFGVLLPFLVLSSNSVFVSSAPSSLVPIGSVVFSRFISYCKRGMIVLVSNVIVN